MMRPILRVLPVLAAVLFAGLAAGDDAKTALGQWMKKNMGEVMAGDAPDKFATLQKNFVLVAKGAPDATAYPKWADFANQGAAAAAKGDKDGVKAACNGCHKAPSTNGAKNMKEQYKADPNVPKAFP
jgi:hypothetical protein